MQSQQQEQTSRMTLNSLISSARADRLDYGTIRAVGAGEQETEW